MEKFIVKQYDESERPIVKGNGFDGLEIGNDREEAEDFINFINALINIINMLTEKRMIYEKGR